MSFYPIGKRIVCFLVYQQELTLAEVSELINKFDPSTEGKECIELGVDGRTFGIIDLNKLYLRSSRNVVK